MFHCSVSNCQDHLKVGNITSGVYFIQAKNKNVLAYCDQTTDGGGWLVIQRNNGMFDFSRTWQEYKDGFGDLGLNFWWGNEKLYQLTSYSQFELRVDLKRNDGSTGYAKYTGFRVSFN